MDYLVQLPTDSLTLLFDGLLSTITHRSTHLIVGRTSSEVVAVTRQGTHVSPPHYSTLQYQLSVTLKACFLDTRVAECGLADCKGETISPIVFNWTVVWIVVGGMWNSRETTASASVFQCKLVDHDSIKSYTST